VDSPVILISFIYMYFNLATACCGIETAIMGESGTSDMHIFTGTLLQLWPV
jgi:hypothetical protein